MAAEEFNNKAPYYYSELVKKELMSNINGSNSMNNIHSNSSIKQASNGASNHNSANSNTSNQNLNCINTCINENSSSARNVNALIGPLLCSLSEESPTSSSVSSSRPSSSRDIQQSTIVQAAAATYGNTGQIPPPASFANPLLNIEAETRGSESLPRPFQKNTRSQFPSSKFTSSKQGIYQRSLSLLANGVSPLLRKKSSTSSNSNSTTSSNQVSTSLAPFNLGLDSLNCEMSNSSSAAASLSRKRRKSEPIMFNVDSINNEMSRLQQRQEQMLENLNLDFETMLMREENGTVSNYGQYLTSPSNIREKLATNSDYGRTMQPGIYNREPLYMLYDDSHRNRAEENIYEEVDLITLSSLRAQYADTLSLQSWKKKGSKKGLSSGSSSSFTRWFSTRKKNSSSNPIEDENHYVDVKLSKKQRPPICLPEMPSQNLTPEQLKRRYIVGSIVDSENSYINSLHRLINDFKKPMEEASPPILNQNKINIIFHRLESILQCHAMFGIALSQYVREWDEKEKIGDVFIASFSKSVVLDIYSDFINNFQNAMETAKKASKNKNFAQFLHDKSISSPDRLSFFGLMVKPVQRFPQFILLLNDLLKHTPSDHCDRMSLQLALSQLETLADRLNERKRDSERHFAVKQVLKDYLCNSSNSSNRYLLRMDNVYILDLDPSTGLVLKTKCRRLYLLNDTLVCVSATSNRLKFHVNLQDVDVIDDVTPATNNLMANSVLRTKDAAPTSSSPQHCTVERMYCDLNNLIHDLEIMSRINNLVSSLRYHYIGLTVESMKQISAEITNEIRRKDAQISMIDRSCFQLRIRSKNYKDTICVQMSDPEVKKDWLTDVRLAKLALDRGNNPAWDVINESMLFSNGNINSMSHPRVPLFVKSLPIFATTETSQLTCALYYKYSNGLAGIEEDGNGVLWICNVNENGSQLGALATNGSEVALIHSYELCDSHITCLESVGSYSVWIGIKQGRVLVINANSPNEWRQITSFEVAGEVTCMKHFNQYVYVGLRTGIVTLFDVDTFDHPVIITLSQSPVTCLLPINGDVYACSSTKIWVISDQKVEKSYSLDNNKHETDPLDDTSSEELRPNLLAHCGIGLWVSIIDSAVIKLYHTETFKNLQNLNITLNVKRVIPDLSPNVSISVTSMLATRGLLWIGTNVGVIVTLTLPRLQGLPLLHSCLNVALHRHIGPVTILLNLNPDVNCLSNQTQGRNVKSHPNSLEAKNEDVESIYGLYADLMKVGDFVGMKRPNQNLNASRITWDLSNMTISDDSTSESASSTAIYHEGGGHQKSSLSTNPSQTMQSSNHTTSLKEGSTNLKKEHNQLPRIAANTLYDSKRTKGSTHRSEPNVSSASVSQRSNTNIYDTAKVNTTVNSANLKTALLMTGGNGYKRSTHDNTYSSQHAHCIIWEYKL